MARMFVMSDNLAVRVEVESTDGGETFYACRIGCGVDLVRDTGDRFSLADTQHVAEVHADGCTRCADSDCRNTDKHDAGHRCRKN